MVRSPTCQGTLRRFCPPMSRLLQLCQAACASSFHLFGDKRTANTIFLAPLLPPHSVLVLPQQLLLLGVRMVPPRHNARLCQGTNGMVVSFTLDVCAKYFRQSLPHRGLSMNSLTSYPKPEPGQSQQVARGLHKHPGAKFQQVLQIQGP